MDVFAFLHVIVSEMNEVQWSLSLNLNPIQLFDPRGAFDTYIKPLMNKYVPDLKGILVRVNKQSLELHPSPDLATCHDTNSHCIIRFHPEYPFAKVNFSVNTTIFCASVGLHVDATVTAVKHQRIVCRYGDTFCIYIIVPLQGQDAEPLPNDPESSNPISVFPRDLVQLEISRVTYSPAGDSLTLSGRILSVLKRGNLAKKVLGLGFDNLEGEGATVSEVEPEKSKKRSFSQLESQGEVTPAKKEKRSKRSKKHHEEENDEEIDQLDEEEQLYEVTQPVKPDHTAPSEKSVKKGKSKKHAVVEDEVQQDMMTGVVLEQPQETPDLLSPDPTTTVPKKKKSKKHSIAEEETFSQEMEADAVSDPVQENHGVVKPDPLTVSGERSSKKSSLTENNEVGERVSLKPDPDSAFVEALNTRRTSKKSKHQEATPTSEAEEVEEETATPVQGRHPAMSVPLKLDPTESHRLNRHLARASDQSPDISTSSEEEESDADAKTTVVTRS
ncbi:hypothetical protein ECG_07255 [Echinococcus granulosus]|uniref:DNA polymerase delta subunit 3 n=1 Tax=Echinococcus granulosus TaxID=6210 RepID=A0A068WTX4_ECHGR|nr:hypothetical protein ECG_07255 [Echinococcus granulosus]CDS21923.1 hypothetical protein EgrG_000074200 [Echinococcus granulosus]